MMRLMKCVMTVDTGVVIVSWKVVLELVWIVRLVVVLVGGVGRGDSVV